MLNIQNLPLNQLKKTCPEKRHHLYDQDYFCPQCNKIACSRCIAQDHDHLTDEKIFHLFQKSIFAFQ